MFKNTSHPIIQGGQFANVLRGDAHFHVGDSNTSSIRRLDLLYQNVATGAFYDAAERGDPPKCHPQTRLAILAELQEWVRDPEVRKTFIMWLYGPAGAGKSAIAQTIAEILAKEGLLVASFFFSRTGIGLNDTTRFVASISYQLSLSIPEIRAHIATAVEHDPLIFSRKLLSQLEVLIIQPVNAAAALVDASQPRLVIVDGLDEVDKELTQKELLEALATTVVQLHIPIIFLVASRPEHIIRYTFNRQPLRSLMRGLALDEGYKPDDDIRVFLSAEFNEIRESHSSENVLPVPWPSQEDMDYLVRKASGQFIYASTVMKYISSPRDNPKKQLRIIIGLSDPGKEMPFAQLDALYHHILSSVKDIFRVLEILSLVSLKHWLYTDYLSIDFIERLLGYDSGDLTAALTDMHALIYVPRSDSGDKNAKLRMYHASFYDFLIDKSRSGRFFLDTGVRHADLARHLLRYITTAPENEDENRFLSVLNGFIAHCVLASSYTEELKTGLKNFSLAKLLSNISIKTFYEAHWDPFFNYLRCECNDKNLYQRLRDEFDTSIRNRYQQYPKFIQNIIFIAYAIPGNPLLYLPVVFEILVDSLPTSDAIGAWKLDRRLLQFQVTPSALCVDDNNRSALENFFIDPSRAGVYFADKAKLGKLAEVLVNLLYRRNDKWPEFFIIPHILNSASLDSKLAQTLWKLAVQYKDNDINVQRKEALANASLNYIKRCGIDIPDHVHCADCVICANYNPMFPMTSHEHKEEISEYTISHPI